MPILFHHHRHPALNDDILVGYYIFLYYLSFNDVFVVGFQKNTEAQQNAPYLNFVYKIAHMIFKNKRKKYEDIHMQ